MYTIYHNNRCSKSREALQYLTEKGLSFKVVNYLETPPTEAELQAILKKLAIPARQLLRTKEAEYTEHGLDNAELTDAEIIHLMCLCPKLIERPIVVDESRAVIARPLDVLKDFC